MFGEQDLEMVQSGWHTQFGGCSQQSAVVFHWGSLIDSRISGLARTSVSQPRTHQDGPGSIDFRKP